MSYRYPLLIAGIWLGFVVVAHSQDYLADSIHYTPIPRHPTVKKAPIQIFRDTVKHIQVFQYFFNVNVGALIGCEDCQGGKGPTFTASTIHGVAIGRKLRSGVGIGFSGYYGWQTLPTFVNVSWDLLGTRNTHALFVQGQYGWAHAWRDVQMFDYGLMDINGGQMTSVQIGYRVRYHDAQIAFLIGTHRQYVSTTYEYPTVYLTSTGEYVPGTPSRTTVRQTMERMTISLSIGWK